MQDLDQPDLSTSLKAAPPAQERPLVLIVEDDRVTRTVVHAMLGDDFRVVGAVDGRAARQALMLRTPDVILLDLNLPDVGGEELLASWMQDERLSGVPVIVLTSLTAAQDVARLLGAGAFDFVPKPPREEELRARVATAVRIGHTHRRLATDVERLRQDADTDALTGLLNRRGGERRLDELVGLCAAGEERLSTAHVDLDAFKAVNDEHGHHAGDQALVAATRAMSSVLRGGDALYRMGGDEFVALISDASAADAERVAARLRAAVAGAGWRVPLSASVGVATWAAGDTAEMLLARADRAAYTDKRRTR